MSAVVLTLAGRDRVGLVNTLASVAAEHGGNWERSRFVELAGRFVGFAEITVATNRAEDLSDALRSIEGVIDVELPDGPSGTEASARELAIEVVGNDRPGLLTDITAVLAEHRANIADITTDVIEAPMAGGLLFTARVTASLPADAAEEALRAGLENLAAEIQVDIGSTPG